jgi:hypothetical protein
MACVCGHKSENHFFDYGHCETDGCDCVGYERDLIELVGKYQRPLDDDLINEPFICYLLCGTDWGIYKSLDYLH